MFEDPAVADKVVSLQHTIDRREVEPYATTYECRCLGGSVPAGLPEAPLGVLRPQIIVWVPCVLSRDLFRPWQELRERKRCKDEGRYLLNFWRQVEAKKAVPKEEQPSGRALDNVNPQRTKKIFVGGLAPSVDENVLKGYFEHFGEVMLFQRTIWTRSAICSRFEEHCAT